MGYAFRQHYCDDELLDRLANGTGKTRAEYLVDLKFPDEKVAPGPSIRVGDFAEIMVADYIEYKLGYWCSKHLRDDFKWNRNESTKGCDFIGFRFVKERDVSQNDELFVFESKAKLTGNEAVNRLQDAVDDSAKDRLREAMTLNALKQRYLERNDDAWPQCPLGRACARAGTRIAVRTVNVFGESCMPPFNLAHFR